MGKWDRARAWLARSLRPFRRRRCRECGSHVFYKVVAGSAVACVACAACGAILASAPADAAAVPAPAAAAAGPAKTPAAAWLQWPGPDRVRITKQQHAHVSPEHADPKHIEADEPPEFVPPPPVGMQRPVRAQLPQQLRGRIYTTPVPPAAPPPPPQPPRQVLAQARQLSPLRGRIYTTPVPPAAPPPPPQPLRRSPVQARLLYQILQPRSHIAGPPVPPAQPATPRPADAD